MEDSLVTSGSYEELSTSRIEWEDPSFPVIASAQVIDFNMETEELLEVFIIIELTSFILFLSLLA